ncbi:hypothetical protein Tco_1047733 [Tanacetum coccineum]
MHEKTNTPRSCLRWIPTGRIFNTVGLKWVPTRKTFTSSTTKVDCEPPNGSNKDITNLYECDQTLNVSASTLNLSACTSFNPKEERLRVWLLKKLMSKNQAPQGIHKQEQSPNSAQSVKEQQQRAYFDDLCHELLQKTTLQAPLLKEKKGVRFSALYLQKKRNLLVFDHSHQHFSYFPMLVQLLSGSTSGLGLHSMTLATSSSRLIPNPIPQQPCIPPPREDWDRLFQPMFDEYFTPPSTTVSQVQEAAVPRMWF